MNLCTLSKRVGLILLCTSPSWAMDDNHDDERIDFNKISASRPIQNWEAAPQSLSDIICDGFSSFFAPNDDITYDTERSTPDAERSLVRTRSYKPAQPPQWDNFPRDTSREGCQPSYDDTKYKRHIYAVGMSLRCKLIPIEPE
jgi:hypothetical protein